MYIPPHFAENDCDRLHRLIDAYSFGTLISTDDGGLNANHLPFELDRAAGRFGTLRAHVARSNPLWRNRSESADVLAIFQGPSAYISPSWYATKQQTGQVVPTYNYLAVHAYGPLTVVDDPQWLHALLTRLTERHESAQAEPWQVSDAPAEFIDKLLPSIIGIEIPITRLLGKWKASQNRPQADRAGVEAGLQAAGCAHAAILSGMERA